LRYINIKNKIERTHLNWSDGVGLKLSSSKSHVRLSHYHLGLRFYYLWCQFEWINL